MSIILYGPQEGRNFLETHLNETNGPLPTPKLHCFASPTKNAKPVILICHAVALFMGLHYIDILNRKIPMIEVIFPSTIWIYHRAQNLLMI